MKTKYESQSALSLTNKKALSFVFSACLRNEVHVLPKGRSSTAASEDYCIGLVLINISQVESSQGGASINHGECYSVRINRNNSPTESHELMN